MVYTAFVFSLLLLLNHICAVSAFLPSPQNVSLLTLNTQYVMRWHWDLLSTGDQDVTFTAQYLAKYKLRKKADWTSVCVNTRETHCDFTHANLHFLGIFVLRVRACAWGEHSKWVQIEFCPDKDALLGPPAKVEVAPTKKLLEVKITDPLTSSNTSMKETLIPEMYYVIQYWKDSMHVQRTEELKTSSNVVVLPELDPLTVYCLRVQSRYDFYNKSSRFSPTQCKQTTGDTPFWKIFLWFLLSLVLCFLAVLLPSYAILKLYCLVKATFYPPYQLPANIQEYLYDSPSSDRPCLLTPEPDLEIFCERLDVCPAVVRLEIHPPPAPSDAEPDAIRHCRQGSGDSGVYSAEEGSGHARVTATQPASDLVKMLPMGTDSGVKDLSGVPGGDGWNSEASDPSVKMGGGVLEVCV